MKQPSFTGRNLGDRRAIDVEPGKTDAGILIVVSPPPLEEVEEMLDVLTAMMRLITCSVRCSQCGQIMRLGEMAVPVDVEVRSMMSVMAALDPEPLCFDCAVSGAFTVSAALRHVRIAVWPGKKKEAES